MSILKIVISRRQQAARIYAHTSTVRSPFKPLSLTVSRLSLCCVVISGCSPPIYTNATSHLENHSMLPGVCTFTANRVASLEAKPLSETLVLRLGESCFFRNFLDTCVLVAKNRRCSLILHAIQVEVMAYPKSFNLCDSRIPPNSRTVNFPGPHTTSCTVDFATYTGQG